MRIGMVCYPSYGGSGVVATELGRHLALRGHIVHFISYEVPFRLKVYQERVFFHEVHVLSYPLFKYPPYLLALANKMVEVARREKLDLIHVHYAIPHTPAAYLAKMMLGGNIAVVTTLHGTDITLVGADPSFREMVRFCIEQSDGVTAVSRALREATRELFGTSREIVTIHNFVDLEEYARCFDSCFRRGFVRDEEKLLIHISNFRPLKRVEVVVEIFAEVNRHIPSRLLMVGDGPEVSNADRAAERLGVRDRVYFLGYQERVVPLLSVADLLLLPSLRESFGLVVLEAMACEVPVVASAVEGLPEVVVDGCTGFLVPPDRPDVMARKAVELLSNPGLHRRFAEAGRARAAEFFSAERIVPEYETYYRKVLAKNES